MRGESLRFRQVTALICRPCFWALLHSVVQHAGTKSARNKFGRQGRSFSQWPHTQHHKNIFGRSKSACKLSDACHYRMLTLLGRSIGPLWINQLSCIFRGHGVFNPVALQHRHCVFYPVPEIFAGRRNSASGSASREGQHMAGRELNLRRM